MSSKRPELREWRTLSDHNLNIIVKALAFGVLLTGKVPATAIRTRKGAINVAVNGIIALLAVLALATGIGVLAGFLTGLWWFGCLAASPLLGMFTFGMVRRVRQAHKHGRV